MTNRSRRGCRRGRQRQLHAHAGVRIASQTRQARALYPRLVAMLQEIGALVVADRSYVPDPVLLRRCEGYAPGADDPDRQQGRERWPGLIQNGGK